MKDRWLEALRENPHEAVSDLFSGRTAVAFETRLDVPELLCRWFPKDLEDDRSRLDDALLWWLREMQRSYTSELDRMGFAIYSKRICDALIALQLLDLPQARKAIRNDLAAWLRWLAPLRLASERDPALECYRLLTQGQPDTGHMAMWLRLAADMRPEYLTVALVGLRRLPNDGDARQNQMLMLQALFRHAVARFHDVNGARRFFNRDFAAVRGLYPRAPNHWTAVLDKALQGFASVRTQTAKDLTVALRQTQLSNSRPTSSHQSHQRPVPKREWQTLERDIRSLKTPVDTLAQRLFGILDRNHEYASTSGDSYNFVHTLSNLGTLLLEHSPLGEDVMARLGVMIERGLAWEPANPYCWNLWAMWFRNQDQRDAQEAILRETLRLFPRDAAAQVELARMLIARGEESWIEADHYLCRTIADHPDNGHAHVVMARLLAARDQHDDAEQMLADFLAKNPADTDAREALDKHRSRAYPAAAGAPKRELTEGATTSSLAEVLRRGGLAGEFSRARVAGHVNGHTDLIQHESKRGDALAGFYSQWLMLPDTPNCPPHAWAWNACLHWQASEPASAWKELAKRFPEAAQETRFLRTLAWPDPSNRSNSQHSHAQGDALSRPVDAAMRDWWELAESGGLDESQREDIACAVMACAAANTPEFVTATMGV